MKIRNKIVSLKNTSKNKNNLGGCACVSVSVSVHTWYVCMKRRVNQFTYKN